MTVAGPPLPLPPPPLELSPLANAPAPGPAEPTVLLMLLILLLWAGGENVTAEEGGGALSPAVISGTCPPLPLLLLSPFVTSMTNDDAALACLLIAGLIDRLLFDWFD